MAITQLSAFLENKPGTLADALNTITEAGINIRALNVAETKDFGILRIIVSDTQKGKEVLGKDVIVKETPVVAVKMDDRSGALEKVLAILRSADVNIEYVYAFTSAVQGSAYVVLRVDDPESAEKILTEKGVQTLSDEDIKGLLA